MGFAILSLTCLQIEIFAKKNQKVEKDVVRFGVRVTIEFGFDFKIFSIASGQYKLLHINFGIFLEPIDNFNVTSGITELIYNMNLSLKRMK